MAVENSQLELEEEPEQETEFGNPPLQLCYWEVVYNLLPGVYAPSY